MGIVLSLFAGVGLIFIGSQFLTVGVKQTVGSRLRDILAKSTSGTGRAITVGIGVGFVIQSPNAITFVAVGLIGAGALTIEAASLIVIWSYVGNLAKLFAAAIDLNAVALAGLGAVGIGYHAGWDKHRVRQHWLTALLGFSLLLFGIQLIITGTVPLRSAPWVQDAIVAADKYYPIGFVIGAVLAVVAQGTTVAIILIGVARGGLLDMDQAAIIAAGALFGMGFFSYMQAANLDGEERQLSVLQLILKLIATAILLPLLLIEHFFGVPTVVAASILVSEDVALRLIFLWWLAAILPALTLLPFNPGVCRLLARLSPATEQQSLAKPQYIFSQAADDTANALNLSVREQARILAVVPSVLEPVCEGGRTDINSGELKSGSATLLATIDRFLASTMRSSPGEEFTEAIISAGYLNQILRELLDATNEFSTVVSSVRSGRQQTDIFSDLAEPLHAMLTAASDRMTSGSPRDIEAIIQLGKSRDELFTQLRARVMAHSGGYSRQQQEAFYNASRLFERVVWLVSRLGTSLSAVRHGASGSQGGASIEEGAAMETAVATK